MATERAKTLEKSHGLRLKIQIALIELTNCMRWFEESRSEFMKAVAAQRTDVNFDIQGLNLKKSRLLEDDAKLRQVIAEVQKHNEELMPLDYRLQHDPILAFTPNDVVRSIQSTYFAESTALAPNNEDRIPPLLRRYFDAVGTLKLAREHLYDEIPYDHEERRARRERLLDQDRAVSESDDDFEEQCRNEIGQAEAETRRLAAVADELKAQCLNAGLNPDPSKYRRRSESGSSRSRGKGEIRSWLDNVEHPPVDPMDAQIEIAGFSESDQTQLQESISPGQSQHPYWEPAIFDMPEPGNAPSDNSDAKYTISAPDHPTTIGHAPETSNGVEEGHKGADVDEVQQSTAQNTSDVANPADDPSSVCSQAYHSDNTTLTAVTGTDSANSEPAGNALELNIGRSGSQLITPSPGPQVEQSLGNCEPRSLA